MSPQGLSGFDGPAALLHQIEILINSLHRGAWRSNPSSTLFAERWGVFTRKWRFFLEVDLSGA